MGCVMGVDLFSWVNTRILGWCWAQVSKGTEPVRPFSFAIEKRNPSKYSSAVAKKEREGKKTNLKITLYRGPLANQYFFLRILLKIAKMCCLNEYDITI